MPIMQADAYAGFGRLYDPHREPGPIVEAACWAHARRKFYEQALVLKAPIADEAVTRIDQLFAIEREINGRAAEARRTTRQERSTPVLAELGTWLRAQRDRVSRKSEIGKAIDYTLKRWAALGPAAAVALESGARGRGILIRSRRPNGGLDPVPPGAQRRAANSAFLPATPTGPM